MWNGPRRHETSVIYRASIYESIISITYLIDALEDREDFYGLNVNYTPDKFVVNGKIDSFAAPLSISFSGPFANSIWRFNNLTALG